MEKKERKKHRVFFSQLSSSSPDSCSQVDFPFELRHMREVFRQYANFNQFHLEEAPLAARGQSTTFGRFINRLLGLLHFDNARCQISSKW